MMNVLLKVFSIPATYICIYVNGFHSQSHIVDNMGNPAPVLWVQSKPAMRTKGEERSGKRQEQAFFQVRLLKTFTLYLTGLNLITWSHIAVKSTKVLFYVYMCLDKELQQFCDEAKEKSRYLLEACNLCITRGTLLLQNEERQAEK